MLKRDGENDHALFLVVTGSLGVFVDEGHGPRRLVANIPAGETVGEMSLISGEAHSAQLVALRDTELLRVSPEAFESLITRHPRVMLNLMRLVIRRLQRHHAHTAEHARPKTFAIVPLQEGLGDEPIAHWLAAALVEMGSRAAVLDSRAAEQPAEWFNSFEAAHDVVFYRGDAPDSAWTHLCLRQADRVLLLARADQPLPLQARRTTRPQGTRRGAAATPAAAPRRPRAGPAGAFRAAQRCCSNPITMSAPAAART